MLRSLKAAESLTPDINSPSSEVEISIPDASIVQIEGQQPSLWLLHDDEHGLMQHLQHLHLQPCDDEGPQLFNDCEKESSSQTNYSTVFKKIYQLYSINVFAEPIVI